MQKNRDWRSDAGFDQNDLMGLKRRGWRQKNKKTALGGFEFNRERFFKSRLFKAFKCTPKFDFDFKSAFFVVRD